jgi:ketosteroid isomerase-like protein
MPDRSSADTALLFVDAINDGYLDAITALMTEDHKFIDSLGQIVQGREAMRRGWQGYFRIVPDYVLKVDEIFPSGNIVVLLGTASGTYSTDGELLARNHWRTPAAWRAIIRDNKVAEWRVYADNEPIRAIMRSSGR